MHRAISKFLQSFLVLLIVHLFSFENDKHFYGNDDQNQNRSMAALSCDQLFVETSVADVGLERLIFFISVVTGSYTRKCGHL